MCHATLNISFCFASFFKRTLIQISNELNLALTKDHCCGPWFNLTVLNMYVVFFLLNCTLREKYSVN